VLRGLAPSGLSELSADRAYNASTLFGGAQRKQDMQSVRMTNGLLLMIVILVLLGSPFGPGGCVPAPWIQQVPGRYQVVSLPAGLERPPAAVVLDTATGNIEPLEPQPTP